MSSFDEPSRARSYDLAPLAVAPQPTEPEPLRPDERAQQAVTLAGREVDAAEMERVDVVNAHAANDRDAWRTARDKLGSAVRAATKAIEKSRAVCEGVAPASVAQLAQLAQLEHRLHVLCTEAATANEPPKGYDEVTLEADLLAAIRRHPEGDARGGFQRKEDEIRALMIRLSPDESRNLAIRIKKQWPSDALAAAFVTASNLGAERQERLLQVLGGAPRREALRVGRAAPIPTAKPAASTLPAAAAPAAQPVHATQPAVPATQPSSAATSAQSAPSGLPAQAPSTPTSAGSQLAETPIAAQVPSAAREDARVAATAAKPQLRQRGHAMQYYRLHQAAFLTTFRARLLAANLGTGSPQLGWAQGPARFVEELGFALTGPESSELPELLYPSDPWALIDAHRGMDADPSASSGAMGWAPAAGLALAGAVEISLRSSLPRMAARYAAGQGTHTASELVASHPMDRVVAVALCADNVVTRQAGKTKPAAPVAGSHDVQTDGLRLVSSYHWLEDPALWNWIRVEQPANATAEEIALTLWNRTDFAYGLTLISGYVAIPKEWARQLPGARGREQAGRMELNVFERSPAEQLAASKLGDAVSVAQGTHGPAAAPGRAAPIATDRAQLVDTIDSTGVVIDELRTQLTPWALAYVLDGGRAFVARRRAALPDAAPVELAAWGPVLTGQRAIVGEALSGMLQAVQLLTEAGVSPERVAADRSHPGMQVLYQYAAAAGTAQLGDTARGTLAQAKVAHAMLPVQLIARSSADAGRQLAQLQQGAGGDRSTRARADELGADHLQLAGETAALQSQVMATGATEPVLLETAGIDAATLGLRAHVANLRAGLHALSGALEAADQGVLAAIANLSAGTRMVLTAHHLDMAGFALGDVELTLDHNTPAAINARWDAMPTTFANREYGRQFELRETRKAQLARAQQQFTQVVKQHGLDGALFARAEQELQDAQIRKLVANVAVMLAVGVASGGIATMAGELASGMVGAGRAVTTIGEATGAVRTARIVGGITNVAVDAGANAVAQTALNGGQLGSSFVENLLTNAAVRAAIHPLHTVLRTWGGLDEQAYALWSLQGAHWKIALAKTTTVSAELVTAAATGFVAHRLTTLAKGEAPDEQTMMSWAIQGATLALAHVINQRLGDSIARLASAGHQAGELVGRLRLQQARAKQVSERGVNDPAGAMQLLVDHQQSIHDEIELWRKVAADPAAAHALGMNPAQVAARLEGAEAQRADVTGQAFGLLPLRFAGLTQEVEGSRLWVGDPEQIAHAIAGARAAGLGVDATAPTPDAVHGQRVWHVTLSGEPIQIRERARAGNREELPRTGEADSSRSNDTSTDRDGSPAARERAAPLSRSSGTPDIAAKLGAGVTAFGANYRAPAGTLADVHASWQAKRGSKPSKIHYDAGSNTSHFDVDVDGKRVRVEAQLAPRIESFAQIDAGINRIVGRPITAADGPGILRALVNSDAAALGAAGLGDVARMTGKPDVEFGLGEISDGRVVVVRGETHAVDWSALPGIEPIGHTHPDVKNNDLREGSTGRNEISLAELLRPTPEPLLARELVFPSADDFIVMAHMGIDGHRVYTPFVIRDGMVMKPGAGEAVPRLEFTIGLPKEAGRMPDGRRVYRSRVEGTIEGRSSKPPIAEDVWIVQDKDGSSGHLYMGEPAQMMPIGTPGATPATKTRTNALPPALQRLVAGHGKPAVQWAHESLPDAAVESLFKQLAPTTLSTIADISASEAHTLVEEVTATRVNNALSHGPNGPIHGKQLHALRGQVAAPILIDLLDAASTNLGRLKQLARIADKLEPASALLGASPINAGSVAIDANVMIAIDQLIHGTGKNGKQIGTFADLDEGGRNAINAIREANGLGAYTDPPEGTSPTVESIAGRGADLRTSTIPAAEAMGKDTPTSQSPALAAAQGMATNRTHPDYPLVLDELKSASVGGRKGAADRSLVLDAMFAENETGGIPKLATADEGVCVALAKQFAILPRTFTPTGAGGIRHWDQLVARFPEGHFTISIRGHKLEVYFHGQAARSSHPS